MIEVKNMTKTFQISKRDAGLKNAFKSLFRREYETISALNDLSFSINEGEMVGYIGPNGAGKSTTIKIMSGILYPDSGTCQINGRVPWKNRIDYVKDIGVVFGQRSQLWWDVPVNDSFELLKHMYKIPEPLFQKNVQMLSELLSITEIIKIPTRQLSLGQRMKCEIVASLLHDPKILFLDEPTIGLDAVSKIAVREFIKTINREKKTTIILTTHDTQDIEALTKRIILIGKGKILLDGQLDDLKQKFSQNKTLTIRFNGILNQLANGLTVIEQHSEQMILGIDTEVISISSAITYLANSVELYDVRVNHATVDDVVVGLYKEYEI